MEKREFNNFLKQLILTSAQVCGNATGYGAITEVKNGYHYDSNGNRTEQVETQNYETVFPDNGFLKLTVKVKGDKPVATNEQIKQKGNSVKVTFKNLVGRIYYNYRENSYAVSCSADGLEVMQ